MNVFVQINLFAEFFEVHGRQAVLFYYQDADTPISGRHSDNIITFGLLITVFLGEMVRWGVVPSSSKTRLKRVIVTDGTKDGLTGVCIFFLRPRNLKTVTSANIADELQCGQFDASGGLTLLQVVREYMQLVMMPALKTGQNWGNLQQKQVDGFMSTFSTYINFLQSMTMFLVIWSDAVTYHCVFRFSEEY